MFERARKIIFISLLTFTTNLFSQSVVSNYEVVRSQLKAVVKNKIVPMLNKKSEYYFKYSSPAEYGVLKNTVIAALKENGISLTIENKGQNKSLIFQLNNITMDYPKVFRENFWDSYKLERRISVSGTFLIYESNEIKSAKDFNKSLTDTVEYNARRIIETPSFVFTRGRVPEEPLFTGLFQPIIAIAAILISIYLLFSVRSK